MNELNESLVAPSRGPKLLWIDDDGPERFEWERQCLEDQGWSIDWAQDGHEAARKLREENYSVVLLDQQFPPRLHSSNSTVWGGCRILYWLRGRDAPPQAPAAEEWRWLSQEEPLERNGAITVIILSAFYDEEISAAIRDMDPGMAIEEKPIDETRLLQRTANILDGIFNAN